MKDITEPELSQCGFGEGEEISHLTQGIEKPAPVYQSSTRRFQSSFHIKLKYTSDKNCYIICSTITVRMFVDRGRQSYSYYVGKRRKYHSF